MRQTSEICTTFIPSELIDHLWNIVDVYDESKYVFVLSSRRLGDGMVQDIRIIAGNISTQHTIFGYKPVDFTIIVSHKGDDLRMSLVPSVKAAQEINKWKRRRAIFLFRKRISPAPAPNHFRVRRA